MPKIKSLIIKLSMILRLEIILSIVSYEKKNTFHEKNVKHTKINTPNNFKVTCLITCLVLY